MHRQELIENIRAKKSFLCVGLDTDITKIPKHLLSEADPVFEFNRQIVEATADLCVAYKPNLAFYESLGAKGWESLAKTVEIIPKDVFKIADAKRGDIGNTAEMYARCFFEQMSFDAVTLSPYMGSDSITPFLKYEGKWAIILALTSNPGAMDFQLLQTNLSGKSVYEKVLIRSRKWGTPANIMYVAGATRAEVFDTVRHHVPEHFLLVPGIGAQGGNLETVVEHGMNKDCGLLVNSSRNIIYASSGKDFALKAREEAQKVQAEMAALLEKQGF